MCGRMRVEGVTNQVRPVGTRIATTTRRNISSSSTATNRISHRQLFPMAVPVWVCEFVP